MRKNLLLFLLIAIPLIGEANECFDAPPGVENIRVDTPDTVRLVKLIVNRSGQTGYIATEYLGSENLQASIYLLVSGKYCLAGDLGALTDFAVLTSGIGVDYFPLITYSKSGGERFVRRYEYENETYELRKCEVYVSTIKQRDCNAGEE